MITRKIEKRMILLYVRVLSDYLTEHVIVPKLIFGIRAKLAALQQCSVLLSYQFHLDLVSNFVSPDFRVSYPVIFFFSFSLENFSR